MGTEPGKQILVGAEGVTVEYKVGRKRVMQAVAGIDFTIRKRETLGLVGESGCGKSTVARAVAGLQRISGGRIWFDEAALGKNSRKGSQRAGGRIQMVFQDAAGSLNPGRRVGKTIGEPLRLAGLLSRKERTVAARSMMAEVGLDPNRCFHRLPFEFSGGQCQRIAIARALIDRPALLICDEPVSSLDASVQAQILNLLRRLKSRHPLTMLFISHDLAVVKNICDRVAVMYLGTLCETGPCDALYRTPLHPYTRTLLAAAGHIGRSSTKGPGNRPPPGSLSLLDPPRGCRFHPRCNLVLPICRKTAPVMKKTSHGRWTACHLAG